MIRTITAKMISSILADDFQPGYLLTEGEDRAKFLAIDPSELDELLARIEAVKAELNTRLEMRQANARQTVEEIFEQLNTNGEFKSVDELIHALTGNEVSPAISTTKTSTSKNVTFIAVIDRKEFKITNNKIPEALKNNEAYKKLIKARPEMGDVDNFLREYSEDYKAAYPLNAIFNNEEFYVNERGQLNRNAKQYYEAWLAKKKKTASTEALKEFKKEVMKA